MGKKKAGGKRGGGGGGNGGGKRGNGGGKRNGFTDQPVALTSGGAQPDGAALVAPTGKPNYPFKWIEQCLVTNGTKTCNAKDLSSKFNHMIIYIYDIIPMMLVALLKRTWRDRVKIMLAQQKMVPRSKINSTELEKAAETLQEWPTGTKTEKDFIAALLGPMTIDENAFRKAMLVLCGKVDNFCYLINGRTVNRWRGEKLQEAQDKGILGWDIPLLKNMLLYYNIGSPYGKMFPLLRQTADDKQWKKEAEIVLNLVKFRNIVLHKVSVKISADIFDEMKKNFNTFVLKFFDKNRDKTLLETLKDKENNLRTSKFVF